MNKPTKKFTAYEKNRSKREAKALVLPSLAAARQPISVDVLIDAIEAQMEFAAPWRTMDLDIRRSVIGAELFTLEKQAQAMRNAESWEAVTMETVARRTAP